MWSKWDHSPPFTHIRVGTHTHTRVHTQNCNVLLIHSFGSVCSRATDAWQELHHSLPGMRRESKGSYFFCLTVPHPPVQTLRSMLVRAPQDFSTRFKNFVHGVAVSIKWSKWRPSHTPSNKNCCVCRIIILKLLWLQGNRNLKSPGEGEMTTGWH